MEGESKEIYRLIAIERKLRTLLRGKRLSLDSENTGVVEMADFGRQCEALAEYAAKTIEEVPGVAQVAEDLELAARLAALLETLPFSEARVEQQLAPLEAAARKVEAAKHAGGRVAEPKEVVALSTLARAERERFEPFFPFEGEILESAPGLVDRALLVRLLRRALLDHDASQPFALTLGTDGMLRFEGFEVAVEPLGEDLERSAAEPPEVAQVLDMRDHTPDEALRTFLLAKAVDEAAHVLLAPRLSTPGLSEQARALPTRPGKRFAIRPEALRHAAIEGWDEREAARLAEKLAARRLGPDAARLPKGAYLIRLFLSESDVLAADLIWLGVALRRMEKGEDVPGAAERGLRSLRSLLGLLG
ncbi:MAG: hypothetical protein ACYTGN_07980 [Planctomycetota bacterium]|jgi:hypothetical protein